MKRKSRKRINNPYFFLIFEILLMRLLLICSIFFYSYEVLELIWASGISQTILYTKPVPLSGDKITQIYAEINFFPDSGHTHPLATDAI